MELSSVRGSIDAIDNELTRLFTERMRTVAEVARVKRRRARPCATLPGSAPW